MKHLSAYLLGMIWSVLAVVGCMNDESYSLSPNDQLWLSRDTIAFDTVFSGQPTPTYTFSVHNPAGKAIRIPEVRLGLGEASPFKVNVDGTFLENGRGSGFEIAASDSMRVFLFMNAPDMDSDQPTPWQDKLTFLTEGGATATVVLDAHAQSVEQLKGITLTHDTVLSSPRPYQILDSLVVSENATLTLSPGTRLYFHPNASLVVHGTLIANGTGDAPVLMRGDRLGYMFTHQAYDAFPNQWGGIRFTASSYGNYLNHCDIHSGCYGLKLDSASTGKYKLEMENSIVHNTGGHGIEALGCRIFLGNSQVSNAGGDCLHIRGGHSTFIHCTIANFMEYALAGKKGVALDFSNMEGESRLPVEQIAFVNCLLTGSSKDEIMGYQNETYPDDAFNYAFVNCLVNTPEVDDKGYVNPQWDDDEDTSREKNFLPLFDLKSFVYSFTLNPASKAVGIGDVEITRQFYPTDRNGRERLTDGASDAGCYEAEPTSEKQNE